MRKVDLVAYLSNTSMQDTDNVVIKTHDGVAHAIVSIERDNGAEYIVPAAPDLPPAIVIMLAE